MLCEHCRKNQATKTYEQKINGIAVRSYYCLECYHRAFGASETETVRVCPYCGTTEEEVKKRNLVGCAKCYETFFDTLQPVIGKMQGVGVHKGKKPQGDESERIARRCHELKTIVDQLNAEKDFEGAKAYTEILSRLQSGMGEEEEYVWRKRPHSCKLS